MNYYEIMGMVAACFTVLIGVILSIYNHSQKGAKEQLEATKKRMEVSNKLNESIITLNLNFEHMLENDRRRDVMLKEHEESLKIIEDRVHETEHQLSNHETRLKSLENRR